ncbi:MAG: AAA family ATPase [Acidimicrobiia bacterium]|nr:AAA family ATPase [Acidimicrobiia bacterium]
MLDELIVHNLGIIDHARLEPGAGFTVITGETGAGKTLLLGALRLLLGESARGELIGPHADEAAAEGRFLTREKREIAAGRRLTRSGRSRAYLDGSVASAGALDAATDGLVEIVGQHDQLAITKPAEVRALIDSLLDEDGAAVLSEYRHAWAAYNTLLADQTRLGGDRHSLERERDLANHQASEIAAAAITDDDFDGLEVRLGRLRNAETLRLHLAAGADSLDVARDRLGSTVTEVRKATAVDPTLGDLLAELGSAEAQLGDIAAQLSRNVSELDFDGEELEQAEQRAHQLSDLKRKYGPSLADVAAFGTEMEQRSHHLAGLLARADSLGTEIAQTEGELARLGGRLRTARDQAARTLADRARAILTELGFTDPVLAPRIEEAPPGPSGADRAQLLFASDARMNPGEISKVASGGELSRLILALRLAGGAGDTETLVFDEVDAGVGGATALAVGRKLATLASGSQVLCVTHLPQVAAFADTHYVIERDATTASLRRVDGAERLEELSRMLAGLPDSERGREAAEELITLARTANP